MPKDVVFRITLEYIKENVDVVEFLKQQGDSLFLVLHQKPDNYHYHGYLKINQCVKTFRSRIKELIDVQVTPPLGMRPFSVSDKTDNIDRYKAYCLYRSGHPISKTYVNEEVDKYEEIDKDVKSKEIKKVLKQERELQDILQRVAVGSQIRDIVRCICEYYKETGRVVHLTKMTQLAHTVHMHITGDYEHLISHIITQDEGLRSIYTSQTPFNGRVYAEEDFPE